MGFFKSEEEKRQIQLEKEQRLLAKYELNDLDRKYINAVKNINAELAGSGLSELGNLLSPDEKTSSRIKVQCLNTLVQQNWIIIRQLDEISKKLDRH